MKLRLGKAAAVIGGLPLAIVAAGSWLMPSKAMAASNAPDTLTAVSRSHLMNDRFVEAYRTSAIPAAVKRYIANGGPASHRDNGGDLKFSMANPGEPYQVSDDIRDPTLPGRRLIFVAKSRGYVFLEYESGGIAHRVHAELYKFDAASWRSNDGRYVPPQPELVWQTYIHRNYKNMREIRADIAAHAIN